MGLTAAPSVRCPRGVWVGLPVVRRRGWMVPTPFSPSGALMARASFPLARARRPLRCRPRPVHRRRGGLHPPRRADGAAGRARAAAGVRPRRGPQCRIAAAAVAAAPPTVAFGNLGGLATVSIMTAVVFPVTLNLQDLLGVLALVSGLVFGVQCLASVRVAPSRRRWPAVSAPPRPPPPGPDGAGRPDCCPSGTRSGRGAVAGGGGRLTGRRAAPGRRRQLRVTATSGLSVAADALAPSAVSRPVPAAPSEWASAPW